MTGMGGCPLRRNRNLCENWRVACRDAGVGMIELVIRFHLAYWQLDENQLSSGGDAKSHQTAERDDQLKRQLAFISPAWVRGLQIGDQRVLGAGETT